MKELLKHLHSVHTNQNITINWPKIKKKITTASCDQSIDNEI